MLNNSIWNIFKCSGNIEAFLYLSRVDALKGNDVKLEKIEKIEKIAVNASNQAR